MSSEAEAWDRFWTVAAQIMARSAERAVATADLTEADRLRMEDALRRASSGLAEARSAMKDVADIINLFGLTHDAERFRMKLDRAREGLGALRGTWRHISPKRLES